MRLVQILFCLSQGAALLSAQEQSSTEFTNDDNFRDAIMNATNTYRRQHNATALEWNSTLAEYANDWGKDCVFEHSNGPYGENLASGYANATVSVDAWGQERVIYDFSKGEFSMDTGHFTQLVWKSTSQVGCSRTECNADEDGGKGDAPGWYVVCEYYPQGNVIDAFVENVQSQVSDEEQSDSPSSTQASSSSNTPTPTGSSGASGNRGNLIVLWVTVAVSCWGPWWRL